MAYPLLIGSQINWTHPLTSELFEGTVVRIEEWFEPEKISASNSILSPNVKNVVTERYLVFWNGDSPLGKRRSWVYGAEQLHIL